MSMNDPMEVFREWESKQRAMGRKVPETTAPHIAKPKGCVNREPAHLEKYTKAECDAFEGNSE